MDIAQVHPQYSERLPDWKLVTASLNENRIKSAGITYLPKSSGQDDYLKRTKSDLPYEMYKMRARFPSLTNPAVTALNGIANRMPSQLEANERFVAFSDSITPNGEPLEELQRICIEHSLLHGRIGLLSDVDAAGEPYIATYDALSIKDWQTKVINGRLVLNYVKLQEKIDVSQDISVREIEDRYRVLKLEEGFYVCEVYDDSGNLVDNPEALKATSERLDYIPFTIIGATGLGFDCDESPMLPLARTAVNIYQLDADYRQSLHMTAEPTPVISGVDSNDAPDSIGSATVWTIPVDAKAYYLEVEGVGLEAQKAEIEAEYMRARAMAGELSQDTNSAESGEALRLRLFSRHANLFSVAKSVGAGLKQALNFCSDIIGTGEVEFKPNLDFTGKDIDAALLTVFNNAVLVGNLPKSVLFGAVREGGYTDLSDEQLEAEIETGEVDDFNGSEGEN